MNNEIHIETLEFDDNLDIECGYHLVFCCDEFGRNIVVYKIVEKNGIKIKTVIFQKILAGSMQFIGGGHPYRAALVSLSAQSDDKPMTWWMRLKTWLRGVK